MEFESDFESELPEQIVGMPLDGADVNRRGCKGACIGWALDIICRLFNLPFEVGLIEEWLEGSVLMPLTHLQGQTVSLLSDEYDLLEYLPHVELILEDLNEVGHSVCRYYLLREPSLDNVISFLRCSELLQSARPPNADIYIIGDEIRFWNLLQSLIELQSVPRSSRVLTLHVASKPGANRAQDVADLRCVLPSGEELPLAADAWDPAGTTLGQLRNAIQLSLSSFRIDVNFNGWSFDDLSRSDEQQAISKWKSAWNPPCTVHLISPGGKIIAGPDDALVFALLCDSRH